jgi:cysteinyl-tRNA synthetase
MVETIEAIIANGHAYAAPGGDVFFDVGSLPGYGRLSGRAQARAAAVAPSGEASPAVCVMYA